jgi:hypothetical protein
MSVKIVDYKIRMNGEGKPFLALILQGGIEIVRSVNGNAYATGKKCSLATSFDEATAKSLIGSEMPGTIQREECEPYEFTVPESGEQLLLTHRYIYLDQEEPINQVAAGVGSQMA